MHLIVLAFALLILNLAAAYYLHHNTLKFANTRPTPPQLGMYIFLMFLFGVPILFVAIALQFAVSRKQSEWQRSDSIRS